MKAHKEAELELHAFTLALDGCVCVGGGGSALHPCHFISGHKDHDTH